MVALIVGIIFIAFAVYSVLPVEWSLQWWPYVVDFLRGGVPIIAIFVGLIAVFIGVADIKDRMEAKKEEAEEAAAEQTEQKESE
jgi:flagellar biosynthesis/type III secretory pathway M-ring protein FliF/YscJ